MGWLLSGARIGTGVAFACVLGGPAPRATAQDPPERERSYKSVYGKLESVDKSLRGVVMRSDAGERLAWRFPEAVVSEAARFQPGDAMIVIYRQLSANEKRVTALAFPGKASTPLYVNTTDARVVLRSAPAVGEVCGQADAGPVQEITIASGGVGEALEACWCCAPSGQSCTPGNRTGAGRALLVNCFQ